MTATHEERDPLSESARVISVRVGELFRLMCIAVSIRLSRRAAPLTPEAATVMFDHATPMRVRPELAELRLDGIASLCLATAPPTPVTALHSPA